MARLITLSFLLLVNGPYVAGQGQDKPGLCPARPSSSTSSASCVRDSDCPDKQKCCPLNSRQQCFDPVEPNYSAVFYIVNLPQVSNEDTYLTNYMQDVFASSGTIVQQKFTRLVSCLEVRLDLHVSRRAELDNRLASLEKAPVNINGFKGGPFQIIARPDESLCPSALPNFSASLYILGVNGSVNITQLTSALQTRLAGYGRSWNIGGQVVGGCVEVFLEALLTPGEVKIVDRELHTIEQQGISLLPREPPFQVTSNHNEAAFCFTSYFKNECDKGKRFCPYRKHCIVQIAFCDGNDDCGDMSDEQNCNCGAGRRACVNRELCLAERAVCDGKHDCRDQSDEENCYFEVYTMNLTARIPWDPVMKDKNSAVYVKFKKVVETYVNNALLRTSNYSYATVLDFSLGMKNLTTIIVTATFKGHMNASQIVQKQKGLKSTGIFHGFVNFAIESIIPIKQGPCITQECGTGLCVGVKDTAYCRCLPGQEPKTCAPVDCRGADDYCGADNSSACVYSPHLSAYTCRCAAKLTGQHCDIDVCSLLGDNVCGVNGHCVGDMYNYTLCACDDYFTGPFCEQRGIESNMTMCQRQNALTTKFLQHLTGSVRISSDFLNGNSLSQQLLKLGYQVLEMPTCSSQGLYNHICIYNITNFHSGHICYCTTEKGAYNGLDYIDGQCGEPKTFDPEEKSGICPIVESGGVTGLQCRRDVDCYGADKCCRVGIGRLCKEPLKVKPGECPGPQAGVTVWLCNSDGDCAADLKCCPEAQGQLCRYPVFVMRFQMNVTLNAPWQNRYANLLDDDMVQLGWQLADFFSELKGFNNVTLLFSRPGSISLLIEVVASPEVSLEDIQNKMHALRTVQIRFGGIGRMVINSSLVTHKFCGSEGCGRGLCGNTTKGGRCLCPAGHFGDRCQFLDPCNGGMCQNGGTCESQVRESQTGTQYNFTCACRHGFMGSTCAVSVCSQLEQGICNSGTCLGKLKQGVLCSCPLDRRGLFCQDNGTEIPYTQCELRRRLNMFLAEMISGRTSMDDGYEASSPQTMLRASDIQWLPLYRCQRDGTYELTADLLSVANPSIMRSICLDKDGNEEVNCQSKVCSSLSAYGSGSICQNNGTCVGNINLMLCDCRGTGHHGPICDQPGEEDPTECQQKHDLAQLTLDALTGRLQLKGMTGQGVKTAISKLLGEIHRDIFWQPDCTKGGSYAYRGCEFQVANVNRKDCFCVNEQHERLNDIPSSSTALPDCPVAGACREFTSDPCGGHGKCVGDLNAGVICECHDGYSGMMCQISSPVTVIATDCQRRRKLANYLLRVLHGLQQPPPELSSQVPQLLVSAGLRKLEVPTCDDNGRYKYICTYRFDELVLEECRCTNEDGTYFRENTGNTCSVIEKPGVCPSDDVGLIIVNQLRCDSDVDCQSSSKCCTVGGVMRQCSNPLYVAIFRVTVTIAALWSKEYSNSNSSSIANIKIQLEDVLRALPGFLKMTVVLTRPDSIQMTLEVTTTADLTAEDVHNALSRLTAAQVTVGTQAHNVTNATYTSYGVCESVQCGLGVCVDTSFGTRCLCLEGTTGDTCQHSLPACNCTEGMQCLRGSHPDTLACACYPENDASCKLPLWYCDGKNDCSSNEKCVHQQICNSFPRDKCQVQTRCIPLNESHVCDNLPCEHGGRCVTQNDGAFSCQCPSGFGGDHCQQNLVMCQVVSSEVCANGCVGDAHVGVLCRCPHGRGGISCDQPAHSKCEQQRALYADLVKIWRGQLSVPGVSQRQLHNMMSDVMQLMSVRDLPVTNCSADGSFLPVQCRINLHTQQQLCHCVNKDGVPISSNLQAYPGFPPCTASYSPEQSREMLCNSSLSSLCGNGGTCIGNLLNGTLCQCAQGYTGILCQQPLGLGQSSPESPRSLCQFSLKVWQRMREALTSGDRKLMTQLQLLQGKLFHASTNMPNQMIKANCQADGQFQPVQCTYNLQSQQPVHCYCITARGVVLSSKTDWPQTPQCDKINLCPSPACSLTDCEHGLARDRHDCEICQCRHPCDGQCQHDPALRCVVEKQDNCGRDNWNGACTLGTCRLRQKPGECPISVEANMTSLSLLKSRQISSCEVHCLDDADCPTNLKCCGLCGAQCVQPSAESTCETHQKSAEQRRDYYRQLQTALQQGQINPNAASRIVQTKLEELRNLRDIWMPDCDPATGFYELTQCAKVISEGTVSGCFCVDRHGNRIPDTESSSTINCDAKPGTCPFLQPSATVHQDCNDDYDCQTDAKCCSDGLGYLCVSPIKRRQNETVSLDSLLDNMCKFAADECGGYGSCVNGWYSEGKVCTCVQNYGGPFCGQHSQASDQASACRRRKETMDYLLNNHQPLNRFLNYVHSNAGGANFTFTAPECLPDNSFAPTQCSHDLDSKQNVECFCVDKQGRPLAGTEMPAGQTLPCAKQNPCDVGAPLHHPGNNTAVSCGIGLGQCPAGYLCKAGLYGDLFCCRDRTNDVDVCLLPQNPGGDCQYYVGAREVTEQRFFFDASETGECKAFTYKGCSNDKTNFQTQESCQSRCVNKEHHGRCPASVVVVQRTMCTDVCGSDHDCLEEQKCCNSSCGRRCVLGIGAKSEVCESGQALLASVGNQTSLCECAPGYICSNNSCCLPKKDVVCQLPRQMGFCMEYFPRYFYNALTRQCEQFVYGGCGGNNNNFLTKAECCNTCGEEDRCKGGVCPAPRAVLSMSCDHSCYGDRDCPANQICCNSSCGGSHCVMPAPAVNCREELVQYHQLRQLASIKGCFLRYKPRCDSDGYWERQQCNDKLGVCWCVTTEGSVLQETRTRGVAQCQWVTSETIEADDKRMQSDNDQCSVCPSGVKVHCCDEDLCLQACPSNPTALCRINPCGGCRIEFHDLNNNIVNCTQGLTSCQLHRHQALMSRDKHSILSLAAWRRQSMMEPELRKDEGSKSQASFVKEGQRTLSALPNYDEGIPYKCHLQPESGVCRAYSPYWFFNVTSRSCQRFVYGLCGGNDNRFQAPKDCFDQCDPHGNPCQCGAGCVLQKTSCSGGKECQLQYQDECYSGTCGLTAECTDPTKSPTKQQAAGVYVPECDSNGFYAPRQCHSNFCWCVRRDGAYNQGLSADDASFTGCNEQGPLSRGPSPLACPAGGDDKLLSCMDSCRDAECPGHLSAYCVVDLCTCNVSFVDEKGQPVVCKGDICESDVFARADNKCPDQEVCGSNGPKSCEYQDPCAHALCPNNPCAICISDPCTGNISFMDVVTGREYAKQDCNKIVHTNCQLRRCEVMQINAAASPNDTLLVQPECDEDGNYKPHQRRADNAVYCVNDFGELVESEHANCVRDPLVSVAVTVIYDGLFESVVPGRENLIILAFTDVMQEIGLTRNMVTNVQILRGSIVIRTDIMKHPDSTIDLAVVKPLIQSCASSGELTLYVDGIVLRVVNGSSVQFTPTTASQVQKAPVSQSGLGAGGIATIVVVLIVLAVIVCAVAVYFLCFKRRQSKDEEDASNKDQTYASPHSGKGKSETMEVINNAYMYDTDTDKPGHKKSSANKQNVVEENFDDHYVKVRF